VPGIANGTDLLDPSEMCYLARIISSIVAAFSMSFAIHAVADEPTKLAPASTTIPGVKPSPFGAVVADYYCGDGLGFKFSLVVKTEGRFTFISRGCVGVHSLNKGDAKIVNDHIILIPELPNEPERFGSLPTDIIPVQWGDRLYLVSKDDGKDFCQAVNQGQEPRSSPPGKFYLRRGDWSKKVAGLPSVPTLWQSWLQKKPSEDPK
jgi:hypothetical protein